jgi:5-methylcytosine-specific restriction endonuclease McrA
MKLRKYSEEELRKAIATSFSLAQTLIKLGVSPCGGNYQVLKKAINHFQIDNSHFKGQIWNKGLSMGSKQPIEKYLNNELKISSYKLKKKLLSLKLFTHICSNCKRKNWLGSPIPLELDHINGNNSDNSLSNLRLLCPNCHALTPTYRGKNKKIQT